jgi:hypothetical protein
MATKLRKHPPKDLAQNFVAAEVRHDVPYMERALADDFVSIGPHGALLHKNEWLQRFDAGDLRYTYYTIDDFEVRLFGATAIVTALDTIRGHHGGQKVDGRFRSAHVWVRQQNRWRLVMHQLTAIASRSGQAAPPQLPAERSTRERAASERTDAQGRRSKSPAERAAPSAIRRTNVPSPPRE